MIEHILNRLIIVAGQWKMFGEEQYEVDFESLLNQLQSKSGLTREKSVDLLLEHLNGKKVAA
ncbi:MAG: hypothetical protein ACE3JQ_02520 [Paenisporosarcina sp.]